MKKLALLNILLLGLVSYSFAQNEADTVFKSSSRSEVKTSESSSSTTESESISISRTVREERITQITQTTEVTCGYYLEERGLFISSAGDTIFVVDTVYIHVYHDDEDDESEAVGSDNNRGWQKKEKNSVWGAVFLKGKNRTMKSDSGNVSSGGGGRSRRLLDRNVVKIPLIIIASPLAVAGVVGYGAGYGLWWLGKKLLNLFRDCPCNKETGEWKRRRVKLKDDSKKNGVSKKKKRNGKERCPDF